MKPFYAIMNKELTKYWDGKTPVLLGGRSGVIHNSFSRYAPIISSNIVTWAREKSAITRLEKYSIIKTIRKDLPDLKLCKFEVKPHLLQASSYKNNEMSSLLSKIFIYYGSGMKDSYAKCFTEPSNKFVLAFGMRGLARKKLKTHLPHVPYNGNYFFTDSEDDLVMLRLIGVDWEPVDLRKI